ncbi:hypothetical protein POM88_036331 [Heracleum sosnowskyi]|uniref:RING-type domain-containing protein n=1 Tax=Heracleum sosnowskyi TaxID=360622 RepID=A0AAD8HN52_9APIA|nr:hypothetical protein POM88_036331 [Heracleum sosnowskyi]
MDIPLSTEKTHVSDVRIFKSHDKPHDYIQGQFWVHVTDFENTDGNTFTHQGSMLERVDFEIRPSDLSSPDVLFRLIYISVSVSNFFCSLKSKTLAEEITAKIMSRFSFISTTSCSDIIIAVKFVRIRLNIFCDDQESNHDAVSSSINNDEEHSLEFDNDTVSSAIHNDQVDIDVDGNGDDDGNNDDDDDDDDDDDAVSTFEDCLSQINGFSEVTGLVDVKPHEVLNSKDPCSICLEEYGSDFSRVVKAETSVCSHMFHRDCVAPWLRKFSNSCPLCRSVFIAPI